MGGRRESPVIPGLPTASLLARHGGPQAEAVARAHEQAPVAAQDLRADDQRVPAVPPPAPAASGLPELRDVRGSRGDRAHRARRGLLAAPGGKPAHMSEPVTVAVDANGAD